MTCPPAPLRVLYEDNHTLAVDKPAGVAVQPDASGDESLLDIARRYLKEKYAKPGRVYLAPAHRLDRPVSGVLLFARTDKAASRLAAAFRERRTDKLYQAVVHGPDVAALAAGGEATLTDALQPGGAGGNTRIVNAATPGAKKAELTYRVRAARDGLALLDAFPRTGYKHQIRAQLAAHGLPVYGDFRYGPHGRPARPRPFMDGRGVALHARRLAFPHPTRAETITVEAPWPPAFAALAITIGVE